MRLLNLFLKICLFYNLKYDLTWQNQWNLHGWYSCMPIRSQWASTPGLCIVVLFLGCMWWLFVRFLLEVLDIGSSVKKIKKHAQYSFFFFFLYYDIILLNSSFQPDDVLTRKLDCNGKVIKEKWGQYFANNHFCTHLCSKKNGSLGIKLFSKAKSTKPSG